MRNTRLEIQASEIRTQACAWIAQLESGDATAEDIASLREWIGRSPRHADEIQRAARASADLNSLTEFARPLMAASHGRPVRGGTPRWHAWAFIGAAVAFLLTIVVISVWRPTVSSGAQEVLVLTTEIGEYKEVELADGSVVSINTDSQLEVDFEQAQRTVRLLQGEALFSVASNPKRPFVVFVGDKSIEAVGTAFVVRYDASAFEVAVTEGKVSVGDVGSLKRAPPGDAAYEGPLPNGPSEADGVATAGSARLTEGAANETSREFVLSQGQQWSEAEADQQQTVEFITNQELQRKLAWREGLFEFSDTPLDEVIREVSRHTPLTIEIVDPEISKLKFGGLYRTGDPKPLFTALKTNYGIDLEYLDGGVVRLKLAKKVE